MEDNKDLHERYLAYLEKARMGNPEEFVNFTETKLADFIRDYVTDDLEGIYSKTERKFYDDVRSAIAINSQMRAANQQSGGMFSQALKYYSEFLQSKFFPHPGIPKESLSTKKEKPVEESKPETPKQPSERELSEGGKKHVEQERIYRNPKLRQLCIEHYGYYCQCCGLNFEKAYGEELGKAFIEVHHLKPISSFDDEHQVDPIHDLVPLCSNCHSMIHQGKDGPLKLGDLRNQYKGIKWEIPVKKED